MLFFRVKTMFYSLALAREYCVYHSKRNFISRRRRVMLAILFYFGKINEFLKKY